jgi:hypothetical protein
MIRTSPTRRLLCFFLLGSLYLTLTVSCLPGSPLKVISSDITARQFTGDSNATRAMAAVSGVAVNNSDSTLTDCSLTVDFFDDQGNTIGSSVASRQSLGPGENWNFNVQLTNADAWKARKYRISTSNR